MKPRKYRKNKTTELFRKVDKFNFFCSNTSFWVDDIGIPDLVLKSYTKMYKVLNAGVVLFMAAEIGAFFTQNNLTEKQISDQYLMTFSHIVLYFFSLSFIHHKDTVTEILYALAVTLKKDFNDEETEKHMKKRTIYFASAFVCLGFGTLISYGAEGLLRVLFSDGTFVTIITVWPEVHDQSLLAGIGRVTIYILWLLWMFRITTAYILVLIIAISLSHQYINLQKYFKSIDGIFEERISQKDKEEKFERALKLGIRLHAATIWCVQQVQKTCGNVFSGHIIVNIYVLVLVMSQFKHADRSLSHVLPIAVMTAGTLFSTGVIMWNAGDVTVEAENLPAAIFMSGWQNCTNRSSYRVRRLLLIAMAQSQKPVVFKSCGVIDLSYESYLSIVKMSYSIFSVLF